MVQQCAPVHPHSAEAARARRGALEKTAHRNGGASQRSISSSNDWPLAGAAGPQAAVDGRSASRDGALLLLLLLLMLLLPPPPPPLLLLIMLQLLLLLLLLPPLLPPPLLWW